MIDPKDMDATHLANASRYYSIDAQRSRSTATRFTDRAIESEARFHACEAEAVRRIKACEQQEREAKERALVDPGMLEHRVRTLEGRIASAEARERLLESSNMALAAKVEKLSRRTRAR